MIYQQLVRNSKIIREVKPSISISYVNGPVVSIANAGDREFLVYFVDQKTNRIEHKGSIGNNCWISCSKRYYVDWRIHVGNEKFSLDLKGKRVYIALESKSLGDTLAWFPYVEEFRQKHDCEVICSTFLNHLFEPYYPQIQFVHPGAVVHNLYAMYTVGWYYTDGQPDPFRNPREFKDQPLQKTAADILGLEYREIVPKISTGANRTSLFKTYDQDWLEAMVREIFQENEYKYKEISVQPGDVVLDLGGNIGTFASYAISKGASKVYTVEPFESYVDLLKTNLEPFGNQVTIIPFAASDRTGESTLNQNFENNTIVENVYQENNWAQEQTRYVIQTLEINELIKRYRLDRINFLKVDIEGSEYAVFRALDEEYLKTSVERIAVEYHWNYRDQLNEINEKLERCGFTVYSLETNPGARIGKLYAFNRSQFANRKQVAIAIHSTSQAKYWNNPLGWQGLVNYLNGHGYKVVLISKEGNGYMGNYHPEGVVQLPQGSLEQVIETLQQSELFIGIGSGLSWLSWACETPTVIISGFSEAYTETITNTYRIEAPVGACRGCFNRAVLDAGDWNWCPDQKGTERQFECSKLITVEQVIEVIEPLLG